MLSTTVESCGIFFVYLRVCVFFSSVPGDRIFRIIAALHRLSVYCYCSAKAFHCVIGFCRCLLWPKVEAAVDAGNAVGGFRKDDVLQNTFLASGGSHRQAPGKDP